MNIIRLNSFSDADQILSIIGSTKAGNEILRDKMKINLLLLKDIKSVAANILKQDALSIGADVAVPKNTILLEDERVDALLIANDKQLKILSKKEKLQPFGLKQFAKDLESHIRGHGLTFDFFGKSQKSNPDPSIMGVLNINEDSFYKESRFIRASGEQKILQMIDDGAGIIDIGAVSSKPGSQKVSADEELIRIKPIIDLIYKKSIFEKAKFSVDSYEPKVIEYALDRGFKIVNDITGFENDEVAKLVAKYDATVVIMHMLGSPDIMQNNPKYENVILDIDAFFKSKIEKANKFGVKDMVLDVGIGFGKTLEHNLQLIKHLSHFKHFNLPILIGASRKSMIDKIIKSKVEDRLAGTLAIHLKAIEQGASIVRCHDVKEHKMAIEVSKAIQKTI